MSARRIHFCTSCVAFFALVAVAKAVETPAAGDASHAGDQVVQPHRVADWLEDSLKRLREELHRAGGDLEKGVADNAWPRSGQSLAPQLVNRSARAWDRDGNGLVSADECRWWLEVAYGFRRPNGANLRTERGATVNHIYLLGLDKNSDGAISRSEFIAWYWAGPAKNPEIFTRFDLDGDGRLTFEECAGNPSFQLEPVGQLARFDVNRDGYVDQQEFLAKATKPQMPLAERVVRAFDDDRDGRLSVYEFSGTPFSMGAIDLYHPGKDGDDDAKLSWNEFYTDDSLFGVELAARYFKRFDLDGDGTLSFYEFAFPVKLDRVAPEVAFQIQDKNSDGSLVLGEIFTEKKPSADDSAAMERYEMRLAHAEDRLMADDLNGDGGVDLKEYVHAREAALRASRYRSGGGSTALAYWLRKGVLIANGLIVLGVAWFVLRRKPRHGTAGRSEASETGPAQADPRAGPERGPE